MVTDVSLSNITDLSAGQIELLEAVGVDRLTALAKSAPGPLLTELKRANLMLGLVANLPSEEEVRRWVTEARDKAGHRLAATVSSAKPVQVGGRNVTQSLPEAIPISPRSLMERGITLVDVPVLREIDWDLDGEGNLPLEPVISSAVAAEKEAVSKSEEEAPAPQSFVSRGSQLTARPTRKDPLVVKRATDNVKVSADAKPEIKPLQGKGRQLVNAPRPETNKGREPHSRSYIRGVLHPRPWHVRSGALVSLLALPMIPLTFVGLGLMAAFPEKWMLFLPIPILAVVAGLLYLIVATKPRCRICGQPMFVPKRCFRHVKAHRFPLIGYIIPTALHMLTFKWFRCIFCGTAVRLKE